MPQLHMPLQSGSDRVLKAMRRSYRSERSSASWTRSAPRSPTPRSPPTSSSASPARPRPTSRRPSRRRGGPVLQRLHLPVLHPSRHARRDDADQVPKPLCRSASTGSSRCRRRSPGRRTAPGRPRGRGARRPGRGPQGRGDPRMSGRARDNRLVHFAVPEGAERARPGDLVTVGVTYGAPHHLSPTPRSRRGVCRAPHPRRRRLGRASPKAACPCRASTSRCADRRRPRSTDRTSPAAEFEFTATDWFARCMQHEFDHLNGKLYVDRLDDKQSRKARKMIKGQRVGQARAQLDAGRRPRPVRTRRR
jgi:hypothetical protein